MPIKNTLHYFSILFFFTLHAFGQQEKIRLPLKEILNQISAQHQVTFNYIEDEIVVYKLLPPNREWTLDLKINYIKKNTRISFKSIGSDSYTLFNNKNMDKPLCGFLIDAETRAPIDHVSLVIENTYRHTMSDEKGYFELPVISSNEIIVSHLNYQDYVIVPQDLYQSNCPEILLRPKIHPLEEVITQRYLASGISKKSNGTFEIDPRKFGILAGLTEPDVLQAMQQIPGIYSTDEIVSNISVRGGTHDQNLFLWNGIRMFQTGHFFGLISAFNPQLPTTITISKNGTSAFFDEGVSSLIDISTHSDAIEKTNFGLGINGIDGNFYAKTKVSEKASFEISGRRSYTDLVQTPTYRNYAKRIFQNTVITDNAGNQAGFRADEDFYFYDLTGQYQQKIGSKSELTVDGIVISNDLNVNKEALVDGSPASKLSTLRQHSYGGDLNWKTKWSEHNLTKINLYISKYNLASTNEFFGNQILTQRNNVFDTGIRIENDWRVSENFTFNAGYQYYETGIANFDEINTPSFSRNIQSVLRTHAAIAESRYSDHKKVTLTAGIRTNYFDKFHIFLLEPRLQFSYALTKNFRAEFLYEQKSQTTSQVIDVQSDFLGIEKRRWVLSDSDSIPIQKSRQLSAGFSYKDKAWLVTVDNFYKTVTGISSSGQGFQNQIESLKINGNYTTTGTELLVQHDFGMFYGWASYGFNESRYHFDGFTPEDFSSNFEIAHTVSAAVVYNRKKLKLALGGKWHSGRPFTSPATVLNSAIIYNEANNARLADFTQFNFSASYYWKLGAKSMLQLNAAVLNIFNKTNNIDRYFRLNTLTSSIETVNIFALQFTPNLSIRLNF